MSRPDEAVQSGSSKRILIVDDHPVFRSELQELISHQPHWTVCGQADSAPLALEQMRLLKPDLAVVDVSLGETKRYRPRQTDEARSPAPADSGAFGP
jgi:DNA-binding NarL/FixJ family response regulator